MHPSIPGPDARLEAARILDHPPLRRILDLLNPPGEETRVVGGAVRNALLGREPGDLDLATTMLPSEVIRCAKAAKLRSIPTGIAHGTVTVMCKGQAFEVTTLREDVETDGRHAVVRFGRDFARDAQRRDFTINALSLGADGNVHDRVGGLDDLAQGRVRFIGDAATRIREDYLRILRFFRFHALYGSGALDPEGLKAAVEHRDGLSRLSRERVRAETLKILAAPGAVGVVRTMQAEGVLDRVLGERGDVEAVERLTALETGNADPILRLAALALRAPPDIARLRERLRLTNAETKRLDAALRAQSDLPEAPGEGALLRLLVAHGRQATADAIHLKAAASSDDPERWRTALAFVNQANIPVLPFGGADVLRHGLNGPAVGIALERLRDLWAEAGFPSGEAAAEALLARAVAEARQPTS